MRYQNFRIDSSALRGFYVHRVGVEALNTLRNSVFRIRKHESVYIEDPSSKCRRPFSYPQKTATQSGLPTPQAIVIVWKVERSFQS